MKREGTRGRAQNLGAQTRTLYVLALSVLGRDAGRDQYAREYVPRSELPRGAVKFAERELRRRLAGAKQDSCVVSWPAFDEAQRLTRGRNSLAEALKFPANYVFRLAAVDLEGEGDGAH